MKYIVILFLLMGCGGEADLYFRPGLAISTGGSALTEVINSKHSLSVEVDSLKQNIILFAGSQNSSFLEGAHTCSIGPMTDYYLQLSKSSGEVLSKSRTPLALLELYEITFTVDQNSIECKVKGHESEYLQVSDIQYEKGYSGVTTIPCCDLSKMKIHLPKMKKESE